MSEEENNVILFPFERIANTANIGTTQAKVPMTIEDVKTNLSLIQHLYVEELLELILPIITRQLSAAGFLFDQDASVKDGALFVESFRSMLCKQQGINHPFQKLADDVFIEEADTSLRLSNKIEIEFSEIGF